MGMNSIISLAVALLVLVILWKMLKAFLKALFFAVIVGGTLYFLLPLLTEVDGPVGDAATETQETIDEVKETGKSIIDGAKAVKENLEAVGKTGKEAVDAVKKAADGLESLENAVGQ